MQEKINIIDGESCLDEVKSLIAEYAESLGRDLTFQGFSEEMEDLSAKYAKPNGRILAAVDGSGNAVGCVAFHRHDGKRCEMKRLYVKPEFRHLKIGRKLIEEIIHTARAEGYEEMVLDTIAPLESAVRLYKKYGFEETEPYYDNPMNDVIYMRLGLK